MEYTTETSALSNDELDMGIDLPCTIHTTVAPGKIVTIPTGVRFAFPQMSRLRRLFTRLVFGYEVTGIGGLVWPRSRHNHSVLAGVIDVGYRGEILVKVHNATNETLLFNPGDKIAQLVPLLSFDTKLTLVDVIQTNTNRGTDGGINI